MSRPKEDEGQNYRCSRCGGPMEFIVTVATNLNRVLRILDFCLECLPTGLEEE